MRHSNHSGVGRRLPIWVAGLLAMSVAGCGAAAVSSAPPTAAPTPVITPDPHLKEPVLADDIFRALGKAKLNVHANNANLGQGNPDVTKQINGDLDGWPLRITQYRSSAALAEALHWTPGEPPGGNEAPYAFAGLNILIQYGPISVRAPAAPDATKAATATAIVAVIDPLLWPLAQRSVVPIPSRTPVPAATPAPSVKPTAKPTKAPTRAPSKAP